jgi:hypothetical protein
VAKPPMGGWLRGWALNMDAAFDIYRTWTIPHFC